MEIQNALEKVKDPQNIQCDKCNKDRPATSYCHDCGKFICTMCKNIHSDWDEFAQHEMVTIDQLQGKVKQVESIKKVTLYCSLHRGKELELYCDTCGELICLHCTVSKHSKPAHKYDLISDTFESHKAEMLAALMPVKQQLGVVKTAIERIDQRSDAINNQLEATEAEIGKAFEQVGKKKSLEASKANLTRKLHQVENLKIKRLAAQKDEVETIQTQLVSCLTFVRECLKTGSQGEIMKIKKAVIKQVKELTDNFDPDKLSPCEEASMKFSTYSPEVAKSGRQLGELCTGEIAPKKCYATGKGIKLAMVGERAITILHIISDLGKACSSPEVAVACEIKAVSSAMQKAKCSVKTVAAGKYNISYQPMSRERHQLHIKVNDQHIKGSPFDVAVKIPQEKRGTPVRVIKGVRGPWGVAINRKGEIIVAESGAHCISIFSPVGEKLQSFGSKGSGPGQFNEPCGVSVDEDDNILVADAGNNRVQKLAPNGEFLASTHNDTVDLNFPIGVKIHPGNKKIFVSDFNNHRIQILNPDLTLHHSFCERGRNNGQFGHPYDMAFDSARNVYVVEKQCNHAIHVFTTEGQYLRKFGISDIFHRLSFPSAISIDSEDVIYVAEPTNYRITIFTIAGVFLASFGKQGSGPGQFRYPYGITVDKEEFIYVSDYGNGQIQIF